MGQLNMEQLEKQRGQAKNARQLLPVPITFIPVRFPKYN
jgi:hypothetical protein